MLKYKDPNVLPPGRFYRYHVTETDTYFENLTQEDLAIEVRAHLLANKIAIPENLPDIIEDYNCRNLPENFCSGQSSGLRKRFFSSFQIRNFTSALVKVWGARFKKDEVFTSPEEAERRAEICSGCPLNDRAQCTTCNQLVGVARKLLGTFRKTRFDKLLGVCELCGCMTQVKVHIQLKILEKSQRSSKDLYPKHCWLADSGE